MSRREGREVERLEAGEPLPRPSKCAKVLYYSWKLCSVVFSHLVMISLVVAYCILGAVTFEKLEADHEREVKRNISKIRDNTTSSIWTMTRDSVLLDQTNWTSEVVDMLKDFENSILLEMKVRGWDGSESPDHIQWTFTGALFYSIIVVTTIGYGHITPKTQTGKVVTIFYAILGIPLMLLCLSNIGDVMASSFRFLYWRVCCYVCTRPPKKRRRRHHSSIRRTIRDGSRPSVRRGRPLTRALSDADCRYRDSGYGSGRPKSSRRQRSPLPRTKSQPPLYHVPGGGDYLTSGSRTHEFEDRAPQYERDNLRCDYEEDDEGFPRISLPLQDLQAALKDLEQHQRKPSPRSDWKKKSPINQRRNQSNVELRRNWDERDFDHHSEYPPESSERRELYEMHDLHDVDYENYKEKKALEERNRRGTQSGLYEYGEVLHDSEDVGIEFYTPKKKRIQLHRGQSEMHERSRELQQADRHERRARSAACDAQRWRQAASQLRPAGGYERGMAYSSAEAEDWSDELEYRPRRQFSNLSSRQMEMYAVPPEDLSQELKPVPIWLCVVLVSGYVVAGAFLFKRWEGWAYLDAAYFCFITLTTIGFGDFVPAQSSSEQGSGVGVGVGGPGAASAAVPSLALCSLYLLFGIALLAMSFNLVQEEVRANVAALGAKLGVIKRKDPQDHYY